MMDMSIKRDDIFVESIFEVNVPEVNNLAIFNFFREANKNHNGVHRSNLGGWQFDMKEGMCPEYDSAMEKVLYAVNHIISDVFKMKVRMCISNSWLNYSARGGLNSVHTHPGAMFSGVYYIKTSPNTGPINFIRSDGHAIESTIFNARCDEYSKHTNRDPLWRTHVQKKPEPSKAFLFSSWLSHEVMETTVDEDRLVAGINFIPVSDDF